MTDESLSELYKYGYLKENSAKDIDTLITRLFSIDMTKRKDAVMLHVFHSNWSAFQKKIKSNFLIVPRENLRTLREYLERCELHDCAEFLEKVLREKDLSSIKMFLLQTVFEDARRSYSKGKFDDALARFEDVRGWVYLQAVLSQNPEVVFEKRRFIVDILIAEAECFLAIGDKKKAESKLVDANVVLEIMDCSWSKVPELFPRYRRALNDLSYE